MPSFKRLDAIAAAPSVTKGGPQSWTAQIPSRPIASHCLTTPASAGPGSGGKTPQ